MTTLNKIKKHSLGKIAQILILVLFSVSKQYGQLSLNVNKVSGLDIQGSGLGTNSKDIIYSVKSISGSNITVGTGYCSLGSTVCPVLVVTDTNGVISQYAYPGIIGSGWDIHVPGTGNDVVIIGKGEINAPTSCFPMPPSLFWMKIDRTTGLVNASSGVKFYNHQSISLPQPQNGLVNTIVGEFGNGKSRSCKIQSATGANLGYMVCGSYCDNSFPSNAASSGITTGSFLLRLDNDGKPCPNFGSNGVKLYYQNTNSRKFSPRLHQVCVNYKGSGIPQGFGVVGSINENPGTAQSNVEIGNDALLFFTDSLGNITYENSYDETTQLKNTSFPSSYPYSDVTDITLCNNTQSPPYGAQENTDQKAVRIKQSSNGGDFIVLSQFDFVKQYVIGNGCSSIYLASPGTFITADPAVMKISSAGSISWTSNVFQSSGSDFENDLLVDSNGDVLISGNTAQEPTSGTFVGRQQGVLSKVSGSSGSVLYNYVYCDNFISHKITYPFSIDFYTDISGNGVILGGSCDSNSDDFEFIWINPY